MQWHVSQDVFLLLQAFYRVILFAGPTESHKLIEEVINFIVSNLDQMKEAPQNNVEYALKIRTSTLFF